MFVADEPVTRKSPKYCGVAATKIVPSHTALITSDVRFSSAQSPHALRSDGRVRHSGPCCAIEVERGGRIVIVRVGIVSDCPHIGGP
jgi:hypothetical protein